MTLSITRTAAMTLNGTRARLHRCLEAKVSGHGQWMGTMERRCGLRSMELLEISPEIAVGRRPNHAYTLTSGSSIRYKLLHRVTVLGRV